jgi:hypothetical protein
MVRRGEVRADGATTRAGRRLLRFVTRVPEQDDGDGHAPARDVVYMLDAGTYVPVEITIATAITMRSDGGPISSRSWTRLTFPVYETLPLTRATEPLLRLGGPTS